MFVVPATAEAEGFGPYLCNGVVARSGAGHYGEVNEQIWPCDDDDVLLGSLDLGVAQVTGLQALTSADFHSAYASAATVGIRIGALRIAVGAVTASARTKCSAWGSPGVALSSMVAGLRINGGLARVITGYVKINLANGVILELNKTTTESGEGGVYKTRQALVISFGFSPGQIVVGEASDGYWYNPCNLD
jgi:hypothetical protein